MTSAAALAVIGSFAMPAAVAAPRVTAAADICPGSTSYPPSPDATVQISTTTPDVGQQVKVSGIHYCPNESVSITIDGTEVGTAQTDSDGAFDPVVTVPAPSGDKQVCGVGASGLGSDSDCLTITAFDVVDVTPPASNGGGTAVTGLEVGALVAIAIVLVVAGVIFTTAGRRTRRSAARG